jgi:hypothetical protein
MVAVIHTSSSLRAVLNYNEKKVAQGQAVCLAAENYPKTAADLSFNQKLNLLQKQASLNLRTKVNSVHISLNFDLSEHLKPEQLRAIAGSYMSKIGFKEQPFLIYEHSDAGHPHIHVLTTNIKPDGSRISLHNLGKNQSEKARKEIEIDFALVKAQGRGREIQQLKPAMIKASYGKAETKKAIANVLAGVVGQYKYTSLPELNAVLNQYNVVADRGSENSRTFQKGGLLYRVLNERGERVGVPIKASDFYQKPTLTLLQKQFENNDHVRIEHKARVKNAIDLTLFNRSNISLDRLTSGLKKDGIDTVLRKNDAGLIYGITYVDHRTKCVFNGSALGKNYSAKAIIERCAPDQQILPLNQSQGVSQSRDPQHHEYVKGHKQILIPAHEQEGRIGFPLPDALLDPVKQDGFTPFQLRSTKRKKKKHLSQQL